MDIVGIFKQKFLTVGGMVMFKKLGLLILGLSLCLFAGCAVNPVTGETQFNLFGPDPGNDIPLGQQWSPEVEKEFGGVVEDVRLQDYIDYVGQDIAEVSHAPDLDWHFRALKHDSVNAFALPGGYVYITTGMLKKLDSEAQLAGVFAHESVHVTARHSAVRMSEQIGLNILLSVVMPEDTPRGVIQATSVARQIVALKYSRDDERQADEIGLDYMVWAGYNPDAVVEVMQILEKENKVRPVEFLSSHPAPQNRIAYIKRRIQESYYNIEGLKIGKEDYRTSVLEKLDTEISRP